jgi:hypothetical protein
MRFAMLGIEEFSPKVVVVVFQLLVMLLMLVAILLVVFQMRWLMLMTQ